MIFKETPLRGAFIIELEPIEDERGLFARTWCKKEFEAHGLNSDLVQCNTSFNKNKGTLRGMHYQASPHGEAKLVRCTMGSIYDVIIDIRNDSATYLQWFACELTAENRRMLYVPVGFAHGFQTLEDNTEVFYQMSEYYYPEYARGISWDDSVLGIDWPINEKILSAKMYMNDMQRPTVAEIDLAALRYNYHQVTKLSNSSCKILAVVKANAYGHGAVRISQELEMLGSDFLGVAMCEEAVELRKAGIIFAFMLVLFVIGDSFHLVPAVTAILGAVAMLLWVTPDIEEMMQVVDWTTLMFFIALFIAVGALQEVGLISYIAMGIGNLVGDNLLAATLILVWSAALLSGLIDNIPFAATMLPVVGYLTRTIPGAESNVLWFALSIGAAMGGNSTLIGSSPNLVTAGIAERAGYRMTYLEFLKVGLPATIITVIVGTVWLLIHF